MQTSSSHSRTQVVDIRMVSAAYELSLQNVTSPSALSEVQDNSEGKRRTQLLTTTAYAYIESHFRARDAQAPSRPKLEN